MPAPPVPRLAGLRPECVFAYWRDAPAEGHLPRMADARRWLGQRAAFWRDHPFSTFAGSAEDTSFETYREGEPQLLKVLEAPEDFERVVLWVGDSLQEQIFGVWALSALDRGPGLPDHLELRYVPTRRLATQQDISLSILDAEVLLQQPSRQLSRADIALGARAWAALESETEKELIEFSMEREFPAHLAAIPRLRDRFPDPKTGLDFWETALLKRYLAPPPTTAHVIGDVIGTEGGKTPDQIGDGPLFERLVDLSDTDLGPCLLDRLGDGRSLRTTSFRLTQVGRDVLEAKRNRTRIRWFERFVGGVHITSETLFPRAISDP